MRESSEWKTSTNSVRSIASPSASDDGQAVVDRLLRQTPARRARRRRTSAASASARSCSSSCGTTSSASPIRNASSARTWRPVMHSSLARLAPTVARQTLRAAAAGDDAEQDLRLAEHGLVRDDAVVAGQRQLAPAAERVAADGGDHEARDRGDRVECVVEPGGDRRRLVGPAELGDVGAGGEDPLAAGDDDGAGRIGGQRLGGRRAARRAAPTTGR